MKRTVPAIEVLLQRICNVDDALPIEQVHRRRKRCIQHTIGSSRNKSVGNHTHAKRLVPNNTSPQQRQQLLTDRLHANVLVPSQIDLARLHVQQHVELPENTRADRTVASGGVIVDWKGR